MLPGLQPPIPGPRSLELARRLRAHESHNITYCSPHFPVFWEKASGANVWDVDGNRFLDFTSGFGVATAGFGAGFLTEAYAAQSAQLYHAMGDVHPTEHKVRLCELLSQATFQRWNAGPGKVMLGSSGFEAVESALKTAFIATAKPGVLCFDGGYHGLGYGAVSVTGRHEFRTPFRAQLADFAHFLPYPDSATALPDLEKLIRAAARDHSIGALLAEPVQGRGGEIFPPPGFLPLLRRLADELGFLLILDEIYTGFFRTGTFFACEKSGTVPDLICLGKALSGSFPISACVGRAAIMDAWPVSEGEALHTSTFLGHPVGCRLAVASLEHWLNHPPTAELRNLESALQQMTNLVKKNKSSVTAVRGAGLMWGLELSGNNATGRIMEQGLARGAILLGGGQNNNVLSLGPNLQLASGEVDWLGKLLCELLD